MKYFEMNQEITGCLEWKLRSLTHPLCNKEFGWCLPLVAERESLSPWNTPSDRRVFALRAWPPGPQLSLC